MRIISLIVVNIKRYLKNPTILFISFLMPVIFFIGTSVTSGDDGNKGEIGFIDKDKSAYSDELIKKVKENYEVVLYEGAAEDNFQSIVDGDVGALYVINEGFSDNIKEMKMPSIDGYKKEESEGIIVLENALNGIIKGFIQEKIQPGLSENYVETIINNNEVKDESDKAFYIIMICYFMFIGSAMITQDLIALKQQKILRRDISTPNSDIAILGGMFGAAFIIQAALSFLAYIIITVVLKQPMSNLAVATLVIVLSSFMSTAFIVFVTRWVKNPVMAMLTIILFSLLTFGVTLVTTNLHMFEEIPKVLATLSLISPFQWMMDIINNGRILVSSMVLVIMGIVFFTLGSFRLRDFVKE